MITKDKLLTMKKADLVATAQQYGADITQAKNKEDIANKIMDKLSTLEPPKAKDEAPKPVRKAAPNASASELDAYLAELAEKAKVSREGDFVTIKYRDRETGVNVNAPFSIIKRTIDRFLVDLPRAIEPQLQR